LNFELCSLKFAPGDSNIYHSPLTIHRPISTLYSLISKLNHYTIARGDSNFELCSLKFDPSDSNIYHSPLTIHHPTHTYFKRTNLTPTPFFLKKSCQKYCIADKWSLGDFTSTKANSSPFWINKSGKPFTCVPRCSHRY
jgi:hypothetical protein